MKKTVNYLLHRCIDFLMYPRLIAVRSSGAVADTYHKLNVPWFHSLKIDTVLDIGANIGRFAKTARYLCPNARIVSFEPLPDCAEKTMQLMKGDGNFELHNVGLGREPGSFSMKRSAHNPSSSFLPMTKIHKEAFPFTAETSEVSVEVKTLDSVAEELSLGNCIFIKVDVQGFEREVLLGGMRTFAKAKILLLELSYEELYSNQPLFNDIYQLVVGLGFTFHGTVSTMPHPTTGAFLDSDCVFLKN